ncbi:apolipoprotein N-acyltransferase [bacterium]|nr:apolipoprotein N-acyltransferase [bacterium]
MKFLSRFLAVLFTILLLRISFDTSWNFGIISFVALIPILAGTRKCGPFGTFLMFSLAAFGFHILQYQWIAMIWSWKVALVLMLYISLYYGIWGLLLKLFFKTVSGIRQILLSASIFAVLELVRGTVLGGFTGTTFAAALYRYLPLIQAADVGSMYLISIFILAVNLALFSFFFNKQSDKPKLTVFVLLLFAINLVYGGITMVKYNNDGILLRTALIQPAVSPDKKWNATYLEETRKSINAMIHGVKKGIELIILPETAYGFDITKSPLYLSSIAEANTIPILMGNPYYDEQYYYDYPASKKFNTAFYLEEGKIKGIYIKKKLSPFAEYSPIPGAEKLILGKGIQTFPGPYCIQTKNGELGISICYEAIFPHYVQHSVKEGAGLLINLSNEAWFEKSATSRDLLAVSVYRAIENRRDLIKVSNAGRSAHVSRNGKIGFESPLDEEGTYYVNSFIHSGRTLYNIWGYFPVYLISLIALFSLIFRRKKKIYYL